MNDTSDIIVYYVIPFALIGFIPFISVCQWIIYAKAGQPGWAAIIPIYATIIRLKLVGKPIGWVFWFIQFYCIELLLNILPSFINAFNPFLAYPKTFGILLLLSLIIYGVFFIIVLNGLSKSFGKNVGFTLGLVFLPFIFLPILAFGSSKYIGTGGVSPTTEPI